MPGIAGYIKNDRSFDINKMTDSLLSTNKLIKGDFYEDNYVSISEVKLKSSKNKYIDNEDFVVFVNGRCFNLTELNEKFDLNACNIEEILSHAYKNNILEKVLNKINGFFEAVIYDKKKQKISLMSDRRGTHFLFYYIKDNHFIFGPEVKSIITQKGIDLTINKSSFSTFMDLGYMLEDNTWFENIKLIKPSSILEYDLKTGNYSQKYYWKFSDIKQQKIPFDEAIDKLAELLPKAVIKMYDSEDTIRVPLSGGLDSRMIAASLNQYDKKIKQNFVTFGQKGCRDIEISSKISKLMKQKQDLYDITNENVIKDREDLVWCTDGLYPISDLHGLNILKNYPESINTLFSGAVGGEVYGCVYKPSEEDWDKIPKNKNFENLFLEHCKELHMTDYYNTPHYHPIIIDNAIRKFSFIVVQFMQNYFDVMLPFLDNDLLDFVFSIPDSYKKDYKLYFAALKKAFPYWYTKIPFQSAGGFNPETKIQKFKRKLRNKINKIFHIHNQGHFFDYNKYIENENTQRELDRIFNTENKFIIKYGDDFIKTYKDKYWQTIKHNANTLLRLVSVKIYFDKISEIVQ